VGPREEKQVLRCLQRGKKLVGTFTAPHFFVFHHVNSFEMSETKLAIDMACYPNSEIVDALFLDKISSDPLPRDNEIRRYYIDLSEDPDKEIGYNVLFPELLELPHINYELCNGSRYRYLYGLGHDRKRFLFSSILKVNTETSEHVKWEEEGCCPSEPIFIASPGATAEDEGILLSVVINPDKAVSFLLVLDAQSFAEIARATIEHPLPLMLHGNYYAEK